MLEFDFKVDEKQLQQLALANRLVESQIKAAAIRAVSKTTRWVMASAKKLIRNKTQINTGAIRARLGEFKKNQFTRKVWMGVNAVPARAFGKPTQTAAGVRVGKRQFDGAFIGGRYKDAVYRRVGARKFELEAVRVPIEKESNAVFLEIRKEADSRFIKTLLQEINFEVLKSQKRIVR